MAVPDNSNDLAVWFRCKLCRGFFSNISEFIEHKKKWHLEEFERTNTHCIVLEEVTPTANQDDDFLTVTEPTECVVNNSATIFQLSRADPFVANNNRTTTSGYKHEIVELFTFDEDEISDEFDDWDHDHTYAAPGPSTKSAKTRPHDATISTMEVNNDEKDQLPNDTEFGGVFIVELSSEFPNADQDFNDTELTSEPTATTPSVEKVDQAPLHEISVSNEAESYDLDLDLGVSSIEEQPVVVAETLKQKLQNTTKSGPSSLSNEVFTVGLPQVRIKRLSLKKIQNATSLSMIKKNLRSSNGAPSSLYTNLLNPLFECHHPGCFKTFTTSRGLKVHSPIHSEDVDRAVFVCDTCKAVFWYRKNLKRHWVSSSHCVPYRKNHQSPEAPAAPEKLFKCKKNKCSVTFNNTRSLGQHQRGHKQFKQQWK